VAIDTPFGVSVLNMNMTATGSTQATAALLTALTSIVTTVPVGSGVQVLSAANYPQAIINAGANPLDIWPQHGMAISPSSVNTAISIAPGTSITIVVASSTQACVVSSSIVYAALSATLPSSSGVLWNNGGVLSIS
jgi:hypothetical protein